MGSTCDQITNVLSKNVRMSEFSENFESSSAIIGWKIDFKEIKSFRLRINKGKDVR